MFEFKLHNPFRKSHMVKTPCLLFSMIRGFSYFSFTNHVYDCSQFQRCNCYDMYPLFSHTEISGVKTKRFTNMICERRHGPDLYHYNQHGTLSPITNDISCTHIDSLSLDNFYPNPEDWLISDL